MIVSLNTNIRIAAEAPNPANKDNGDLSMITLIINIVPTKTIKPVKFGTGLLQAGLAVFLSGWSTQAEY